MGTRYNDPGTNGIGDFKIAAKEHKKVSARRAGRNGAEPQPFSELSRAVEAKGDGKQPQRNNPQISQITQIQLLQSFTEPFIWPNKPPVIRPIHLALSFPQREIDLLRLQRSSTESL